MSPATATAIDLSPLINTVALIVATLIWAAYTSWSAKHMKDKQAVAVIDEALKNGLGAMQQAVQNGLSTHPLQVQMPRISAPMAAGIQYVIDQVPDALSRMGISKEEVAQKLSARLGVQNIATNVATAASPGPSPQPLSPLPNPSQP